MLFHLLNRTARSLSGIYGSVTGEANEPKREANIHSRSVKNSQNLMKALQFLAFLGIILQCVACIEGTNQINRECGECQQRVFVYFFPEKQFVWCDDEWAFV